ncbi:MAG: MBL fold metallo-hydrolase [Clostridia bacterium]|nr:MBL fold metallo-hydrolase [Clostridia bacterium]
MKLKNVLVLVLAVMLFCSPALADVVRDDQLSAFPVKNADGTWAENGPVPFDAEETREGMLEIWFGRVSVCDCFILRCNGETMMIDGGMIQHSAGTLYLLDNLGITGVNYLFNTHHHDDHLEMQEYLLRKKGFHADVFMTPYERGHRVARQQKMEKTVDSRGIPFKTLYSGDTLMLGGENGAQITFYRWLGNTDANYSSMMCKVVYGDRSVYFMADVTGLAQKELALHHLDEIPWDADIFKVGHHGYAQQDQTLLDAISPELCIITNSKQGAAKAVKQFDKLGLHYLNTPNGTIYARTDGGENWYYTQDKSHQKK